MTETDAPRDEVRLDLEAISALRARALRQKRWTVIIPAVGAAAFGLLGLWGLLTDVDAWWLVAVPGVAFAIGALFGLKELDALRRQFEGDVTPVAMRFTADGMEFPVAYHAPEMVRLPWEAVAGFQVATASGHRFLVLQLAPGIGAESPGVTGLDHPDIQRALRRKVQGIVGIRWGIDGFQTSLESIDQMTAQFTDGRVRIQ